MTRRDYEIIANVISAERRIVADGNFDQTETIAIEEALDRVSRRLAIRFGEQYDNFQYERFLTAARVPQRAPGQVW